VRLLDYLSGLGPVSASPDGLVRGLRTLVRYHPGGGLLVLISDLLDVYASKPPAAWGEELDSPLAQALHPLATPRWQVLVLHYLHPQEVAPSLEGDVDLRDVETGRRLPFSLDPATLARYRERSERWVEELRTACAQRGANYARVLADWPLETAILPYLRQRGVFE
jgi:hypothetical protein